MPIDFKPGHVYFDPTAGIVQVQEGHVTFPSRVIRADVAIQGFDIFFTGGDHSLHRERIVATVAGVAGPTVTFRVEFLLRDFSGEIDDPFEGDVWVLAVAELASERVRAGAAAAVATRARSGQ